LKVGDQIDVLRRDKVRDLELTGWTRGLVLYRGEQEEEEDHKTLFDPQG
jgi:hypothetical protein